MWGANGPDTRFRGAALASTPHGSTSPHGTYCPLVLACNLKVAPEDLPFWSLKIITSGFGQKPKVTVCSLQKAEKAMEAVGQRDQYLQVGVAPLEVCPGCASGHACH